jgi:hypothetical protein
VRGHDFHSSELFADMTEAAAAAAGEPMWGERRWCLPLVDWGCAISTWIDCRDPSGPLWGWDPHMCCFDHAFFPLDQTLAEMLTAWLPEQRRDVFYPGYFDDLKRASPPGVCAPLVWRVGRIDVADSLRGLTLAGEKARPSAGLRASAESRPAGVPGRTVRRASSWS